MAQVKGIELLYILLGFHELCGEAALREEGERDRD